MRGAFAPLIHLPNVTYLFPERVFNMGLIPLNRASQAMVRRQLGEGLPVVVFRWGPVPVVPSVREATWNKIDCEAVLMRALPRSRFRGAFGEQVRLPVGTAETLERFEQELRAVGLVRENEVLRQGAKLPAHFRVQVRDRKLTSADIHEASSNGLSEAGVTGGERAPKLRCREPEVTSKVLSTFENGVKRKVHDKRPKGRRVAPT